MLSPHCSGRALRFKLPPQNRLLGFIFTPPFHKPASSSPRPSKIASYGSTFAPPPPKTASLASTRLKRTSSQLPVLSCTHNKGVFFYHHFFSYDFRPKNVKISFLPHGFHSHNFSLFLAPHEKILAPPVKTPVESLNCLERSGAQTALPSLRFHTAREDASPFLRVPACHD